MKHKNFKENINASQNYSRRLISGKVTATAGIRNPENLTMVYGLGANRIEILRALEKQNRFKIIWYVLSIIAGLVCLILEPKSWLYVIRLFIILINLDLVSRGKIIGIYIGILDCLLYIYLCFSAQLYGEILKMILINIPLNIFSIISWTKNLKQSRNVTYKQEKKPSEVIIRKMNKKSYIYVGLALAVSYVACYFGLKLLNTASLIFSAGALAFNIFYKIYNGLRYRESWTFAIFADIFSMGMWVQIIVESVINGNLDLTTLPSVITNISALAYAFYASSLWKSMYRKVAINGGEILAIRSIKVKKIIKLRRRYQKLIWNEKIDSAKNS